jgi:hypothetical protein
MKREPVATAETRYIRAAANILVKESFFLRRLIVWIFRRKKSEGSRKVRFSTLKVMAL